MNPLTLAVVNTIVSAAVILLLQGKKYQLHKKKKKDIQFCFYKMLPKVRGDIIWKISMCTLLSIVISVLQMNNLNDIISKVYMAMVLVIVAPSVQTLISLCLGEKSKKMFKSDYSEIVEEYEEVVKKVMVCFSLESHLKFNELKTRLKGDKNVNAALYEKLIGQIPVNGNKKKKRKKLIVLIVTEPAISLKSKKEILKIGKQKRLTRSMILNL